MHEMREHCCIRPEELVTIMTELKDCLRSVAVTYSKEVIISRKRRAIDRLRHGYNRLLIS